MPFVCWQLIDGTSFVGLSTTVLGLLPLHGSANTLPLVSGSCLLPHE